VTVAVAAGGVAVSLGVAEGMDWVRVAEAVAGAGVMALPGPAQPAISRQKATFAAPQVHDRADGSMGLIVSDSICIAKPTRRQPARPCYHAISAASLARSAVKCPAWLDKWTPA
jgi:hypothetical protein